jgi:hypothetical protein
MRLARTVFNTFSLSQGIRQGLWADLNRSESIEPPHPSRTLSHQNLSFHQKVMRLAGLCVAKRSANPRRRRGGDHCRHGCCGGCEPAMFAAARRRRDILSLLGNGSTSSLLAPPSMSRNYDVG